MHKEGKAESGANNDYGRVPTLSLYSKPSGGADLRVSRGFGGNTRFGGAAAPPYQGQGQAAPNNYEPDYGLRTTEVRGKHLKRERLRKGSAPASGAAGCALATSQLGVIHPND